MNVVIFADRVRGHHGHYAGAFAAGLARHGVDCEIVDRSTPRDCDLAVTWGHRATDIYDRQRAAGRRYLVMERGYVGDRFHWTALGFDGLNGRADFCLRQIHVDGSRWDRLFGPGHLRPWKDPGFGRYVLVMGQVRGDASLAGADIDAWYRAAVAEARIAAAFLGLPVMFRPHPQGSAAPDGVEVLDGPLVEALAGAAWVVTYSSNSAVDALLAGVPAVACDRGSMAWKIAGHDPSTAPPRHDRGRWAHELAWCQWSEDEIRAGDAWDHLKEGMD